MIISGKVNAVQATIDVRYNMQWYLEWFVFYSVISIHSSHVRWTFKGMQSWMWTYVTVYTTVAQ